jgi:hypothetical protein
MPVQGKAPAPETLGDVPVLRRSVLPLALMSLAATTLLTHQALPPSSTRLASVTTLESAGFDSLPTGRISAKSFNAELGGGYWDEKNYDDSSVQTDTRGTGKVYRLTLQAGTIHDNPSGNNGIVAVIPLAKQVDNACLAYDIRFDPNFDWSLGGKLPGLSGVAPGVAATWPAGGNYGGSKGWSGRMMWHGGGKMESYMYGPKQTSRYGDGIAWPKTFVRGRWHRVQMCYTMNTPGTANGKLQTWFDGQQVLNITNHVYRTRSDVHISHMMWSIFRGGSTMDWAGSRTSYIDIDKVTITTG